MSLQRILEEAEYIRQLCESNGGTLSGGLGIGDIEAYARRLFVNPASYLLKYVRFFSAAKIYLTRQAEPGYYTITIEIYVHKEDQSIVEMYPELCGLERLSIYVYRS